MSATAIIMGELLEQPYADGLKGYGFPATSRDGKQLLIMHFQKDKAPMPMLLDFGKSSGRVLPEIPGLWQRPSGSEIITCAQREVPGRIYLRISRLPADETSPILQQQTPSVQSRRCGTRR